MSKLKVWMQTRIRKDRLLLLLCIILIFPRLQAQNCIVFGTYAAIPSAVYNCAFGIISFNYSSWEFTDMGNGNVKVSGSPMGSVPVLTGSINCDDSTFSTVANLNGTCSESYFLHGKFISDTSWNGTFEVMFSGSNCFDCVSRIFLITGTTNNITGMTAETIPTEASLHQNFPNPFNPSTKIIWQTPVSSWQTLKVYDVLGNEVATLVDEYKPSGSYEIEFKASTLSSGIYFYTLQAGEFVQTKKLILMK
jgi:hypothetical protein